MVSDMVSDEKNINSQLRCTNHLYSPLSLQRVASSMDRFASHHPIEESIKYLADSQHIPPILINYRNTQRILLNWVKK